MPSGTSDQQPVPRLQALSINIRKRSSGKGKKRGNGPMAGKGEAAAAAGGEPLSPVARLFREPHFNCHIIAEFGCATPIDVDVVKAGLRTTLLRHPRFSSVQDESGAGKPKWVRTTVNLDDHIIVPELQPAGTDDQRSTDEIVEDYVASLTTSSGPVLDPSRPLWDAHILQIRTSRAAAIGVLRAHHSLGDGISLISLLLACTRKLADPVSPPSLPVARRRAPPSPRTVMAAIWSALVVAWYTIVDMAIFLATSAFLRDTKTPLKGKEGVEFHPKRIVHRAISLYDVKAVKNAVGCTVNDVLVGVASAGMSRYLSRKYGECLPKNIRIRSTLLVNIRPTPGIQDLAYMMEKNKRDAKWGNWLGYLVLPFPIVLRDDPLDYVRHGKKITERKRSSLEAILTYKCCDFVVKFLGIKAAAVLSHRVLSHTTLSFSNIVGPLEEIMFYGHPMVYLAPSVYGHPQALTIHFQSYMNEMEMVLAVDEQAIPDPHQLLDDLAESLKVMKDAAVLVRAQG